MPLTVHNLPQAPDQTKTSRSNGISVNPDDKRFYDTPPGKVLRVTSICDMDGSKTWAFLGWAAKVEYNAVSEAAWEIHNNNLYPTLKDNEEYSKEGFLRLLQHTVGPIRAHKKESQKALDIGLTVHKLIEWYVRGIAGIEPGSPPPEAENDPIAQRALDEFKKWAELVHFEPIEVETTVAHIPQLPDGTYLRLQGYAGTFDALARVNGKVTVCDWKTSKAIYINYRMQVAAYLNAIELDTNHGWPKPEQSIIVRLPKLPKGNLQTLTISDRAAHEADLAAFYELLRFTIWHLRAEKQDRAAKNVYPLKAQPSC